MSGTTTSTTTAQPLSWPVIAELRLGLVDVSISDLDSGQLVCLTQSVRLVESAVALIKIRIAKRAGDLAQDGRGPDPTETSLGDGEVSAKTAREEAARAKTVGGFPGLSDALKDGAISPEHIDSVTRQTKNLSVAEQATLKQDEEGLVGKAKALPVDSFNRHLARRIDDIREDHGHKTQRKQRSGSFFRHWVDKATGMGRFVGALDPERYESVVNAVEAEMRSMVNTAKADGSTESLHLNNHLAATALVELVSHGNGAQGRPNIIVVTDQQTLSTGPHDYTIRQTRDGHDLSTETVARLCCDAVMQRVVIDAAGVPINVGRGQRTATLAQWAGLNAIYSTCAWAGCDRPVSWCQAHHIQEWDPNGLTDLDNLIPLCSTHHHRVHEGRWTIKLLPDRTLKIYRPDGTHHTNTNPDRLKNWLTNNQPKQSTAPPSETVSVGRNQSVEREPHREPSRQ